MASTLIFFAEKNVSSYSLLCSKNINVFINTLATTVNKFVINKLIKLTMLRTTGPRNIVMCYLKELPQYNANGKPK